MNLQEPSLDPNVLVERLRCTANTPIVDGLLGLCASGRIRLYLSVRWREDIPRDPWASQIEAIIADYGLTLTAAPMTIGYGMIDRDVVMPGDVNEQYERLRTLARERRPAKKKPFGWEDRDHLLMPFVAGRDVFLSWDEDYRCIAPEIQQEFRIAVLRPEGYLQALSNASR